jgi:hypothetical protein
MPNAAPDVTGVVIESDAIGRVILVSRERQNVKHRPRRTQTTGEQAYHHLSTGVHAGD